MASNPFSLSKLAGMGLLVAIILALAIPMANYIYQPYGTTSASNVVCAQPQTNSTANPNVSQNQYTIDCLGEQLYGLNYSNTANSPEGYIFNLTQQTAFPSNTANGTGGLLAGSKLQNSIGLAFVFAGIGTLIQTVSNFGAIFNLIVGSLIGLLPN